jgi:hypothetical protein
MQSPSALLFSYFQIVPPRAHQAFFVTSNFIKLKPLTDQSFSICHLIHQLLLVSFPSIMLTSTLVTYSHQIELISCSNFTLVFIGMLLYVA